MSTTQLGRMMRISTPLDEDFLLINKLSATEALSELFRLDVELLHEENEAGSEPTLVNIEDILGQAVVITITQRDGTERIFHGIVSSFSQGNRDERFSYYYATIVPRVWRLTQNYQSQIFQQMSVPDILKEIFAEYEIDWKFQRTYEPRDYCVQYQETDFDFASRLMEEEGIFYYFEHTEESQKMIVGDSPDYHFDCPSKNEIPCFLEMTPEEDWVSSIGTWRLDYKLQTGKVTLWDSHFELPGKSLDTQLTSQSSIAGNGSLEIYEYPAGYARKYDGINKGGGEQSAEVQKIFPDRDQTVKNRMQEIDAQYKIFNGISNCCSITAGYRFKLFNHPNKDFNVQYTLLSVSHQIEQSPDYATEEEVANPYGNSFTCIMHGGQNPPFRPARKTAKPVVRGSQTAFVVTPPGEEIFTDKYGRVKVQFQWDRRETANDANSSCWIRVAQSWAGNRWGMMFIPRVGMEVIVDFLEGDPDRPIITGCVYNAKAMPPYKLPDEKTKMTIKSDSSTGGQGFNELRFEDKKGSEQVFVHAEKDMDVRVKNDRRTIIGNDEHLIVRKNRRENIDGDTHLTVGGDQKEKVKGSHHLKIEGEQRIEVTGHHGFRFSADSDEIIVGNKNIGAHGDLWLAGTNVVIKGDSNLTLQVGGNHIVIDSSGIYIKGSMVHINSAPGSPKSGEANTVAPEAPAQADEADDAKPGTKIELEKRSALRKQEKKHKESENKKSWIKVKLVDEAGKPVRGETCRIVTPSGRVSYKTTDKNGKVHIKGIDPGSCEITFPELDKDAWEEA